MQSKTETPRKDAIIYLPGGPGQGYTDAVANFLEAESIQRLLLERDIILFDPRGCGTSEPQLCYGLEDPDIINADFKGVSSTEYWQGIAQAMNACHDSLASRGPIRIRMAPLISRAIWKPSGLLWGTINGIYGGIHMGHVTHSQYCDSTRIMLEVLS